MRRFSHATNFGIELRLDSQRKGIPQNRNHRKHPNPRVVSRSNGGGFIRVPDSFDNRKLKRHLEGTRACFYKASAVRGGRVGLHALDFDTKSLPYEMVRDAVIQAFAEVLPGVSIFVEPSRSYDHVTGIGGAYAWFTVEWGDTALKQRNSLLNALSRDFRRHCRGRWPGAKADGVKGTYTYRSPNPAFDAALASELYDVACVRECFVRELGCFLPLAEAATFWHKRLDDLLSEGIEIRRRWEPRTRQQAYETRKRFYGINGGRVDPAKRFKPEPRLEQVVTTQGLLVTAPCYAAKSGRRPDNVARFIAWHAGKPPSATVATLQAILAREVSRVDAESLRQRRPREAGRPCDPRVPHETSHVAAGAQKTPLPQLCPRSRDGKIYFDAMADSQDRYAAAARIACRDAIARKHLGQIDHRHHAIAITLALVESPEGPATLFERGRTPQRVARVERLVDHFLPLTRRGAPGHSTGRWFHEQDLVHERDRLAGFIRPAHIDSINRAGANRRITREILAFVCLLASKNLHEGRRELGEVCHEPLWRAVRQRFRMGINAAKATVGGAMHLLVSSGVFMVMRGHLAFAEGPKRGRLLVLGTRGPKTWSRRAFGDAVLTVGSPRAVRAFGNKASIVPTTASKCIAVGVGSPPPLPPTPERHKYVEQRASWIGHAALDRPALGSRTGDHHPNSVLASCLTDDDPAPPFCAQPESVPRREIGQAGSC